GAEGGVGPVGGEAGEDGGRERQRGMWLGEQLGETLGHPRGERRMGRGGRAHRFDGFFAVESAAGLAGGAGSSCTPSARPLAITRSTRPRFNAMSIIGARK